MLPGNEPNYDRENWKSNNKERNKWHSEKYCCWCSIYVKIRVYLIIIWAEQNVEEL